MHPSTVKCGHRLRGDCELGPQGTWFPWQPLGGEQVGGRLCWVRGLGLESGGGSQVAPESGSRGTSLPACKTAGVCTGVLRARAMAEGLPQVSGSTSISGGGGGGRGSVLRVPRPPYRGSLIFRALFYKLQLITPPPPLTAPLPPAHLTQNPRVPGLSPQQLTCTQGPLRNGSFRLPRRL